jgi:hypothetical protein
VIERFSGETTVALKISIFNAAKTRRNGPINGKLSVRSRKPEKIYTAIKHPAISREKTLNLISKRLLLFSIVPPFSKAILSNYAMLSRVETNTETKTSKKNIITGGETHYSEQYKIPGGINKPPALKRAG